MPHRKLLTHTLIYVSLFCLSGFSTANTLNAATLTWTVDGSFANGSALSGTFDYDASTGLVSNWNLTGVFHYNYTPADSVFTFGRCCTDQVDFIFTTFDTALTLDFAFRPNLPSSGAATAIAGGDEIFQLTDKPATSFALTGGTAVSGVSRASAPEPGSLFTGFFLCVAGGAGLIWRRQHRELQH